MIILNEATELLKPSASRVDIERSAEAARWLSIPYLTVDIGQKESGEWIVVEVDDAQFAGLSQVSPLRLWSRLKELRS